MATKPIPDGYQEVTPFIIAADASGLIDYISEAFGARTRYRIDAPGGKVGHAELQIGGSVIFVADPDERTLSVPACLHLYVDECDRVFAQAVAAGGTVAEPVETKFYGDRSGCVTDRWGNRWYISTRVEEVSEEELQKRLAAMAPS